jgi:hypothetical protein
MAFDLVVQLTGLCAYVFNPDHTAVRVLMPRALGGLMGGGEGGIYMESHVPAIVFDLANVDDSSERPIETFSSRVDSGGFCRLDGQDLVLGDASKKLYPNFTKIKPPCPKKDGTDLASLRWLAPLPEILAERGSGCGDVDPCCFDPANVPGTVAARVRLTEGTLATKSVFSKDDQPVEFQAGRCKQAFAEVVEFRLPVPGRTFTLKTKSFAVDATYRPLVLKPKGADQIIVIQVVNLAEDDLKRTRKPNDFEIKRPRKADRHFQMFYPLSSQGAPADGGPIPLAVGLCPSLASSSGPTLGSPQCPGGAYNPHPSA